MHLMSLYAQVRDQQHGYSPELLYRLVLDNRFHKHGFFPTFQLQLVQRTEEDYSVYLFGSLQSLRLMSSNRIKIPEYCDKHIDVCLLDILEDCLNKDFCCSVWTRS